MLKKVGSALWLAVNTKKARKLETALIALIVSEVLHQLGLV